MHSDRCIRSDGDWLCAGGCTHDRDENNAYMVNELDRTKAVLALIETWTHLYGMRDAKEQVANILRNGENK